VPAQQQQQPVHAYGKQNVQYEEAAARIVAEEREQRGRLPRYSGLERFKLHEKMGEYYISIIKSCLT
jgi:hypothetical protein